MPAYLKPWGINALLVVIVVVGIIIFLCHQSVGPPPVSIKYVGTGLFPHGTTFGNSPAGPTFAITNNSSKSKSMLWHIQVRNGTNWIEDIFNPAKYAEGSPFELDPKEGTYVTVHFVSRIPTNSWRLYGTTIEELRWPARVAGVLRWWWVESKSQKNPISSLFSPNPGWYGNRSIFASEEVPAPKSRQ